MGLWVYCPSSAEGRSGAAGLWGREARGGWRRAPAALPSFGEEAFGPFPSPGSRCSCFPLLPQVGKAVFSPPAPGGAALSEVGGGVLSPLGPFLPVIMWSGGFSCGKRHRLWACVTCGAGAWQEPCAGANRLLMMV